MINGEWALLYSNFDGEIVLAFNQTLAKGKEKIDESTLGHDGLSEFHN
jgi:hypothetical protein